jgi:tRNA dimethylallyltransferase
VSENNTFVLTATLPILIVISGPTATGKSGLAMQLANRLPGVILSADSRQVYREFNIGTAKPSWNDRQQIPHYLIDICDPTETLTLADYQAQAQVLIGWIHDIESKGQAQQGFPDLPLPSFPSIPLLVGGTGLYIKSIMQGLRIPTVAPQLALRSQLQDWGQPQCYAVLCQVDPAAAAKIHAHDQVRTLRALEVFYVTGQPISQQQGEQPPTYPILHLGLDCNSTEGLAQRIEHRTAQMMADGFVAEVEGLCSKYGTELPLLDTLGYREIKQYLRGEISLVQAETLTVLHTRQFAKRQRTWFRADRTIEWFDADADDLLEQVWQRVQQFMTEQVKILQ